MQYNIPYFFNKSDRNIKKLIKEQYGDFLEWSYISSLLTNFDGGYIIVSYEKKLILEAFTLFNINGYGLVMNLHVVCSRESYNKTILINTIFTYCISNSINICRICILSYLLNFYINHDFVLDNILYKRSEIKYYSMNRNFNRQKYI